MTLEEEYKNYCNKYNSIYKFLRDNSKDTTDVAMEICKLRRYYPERMLNTIKSAGFIYLKNSIVAERLEGVGTEFGLFSKKGNFLLKDRYIFPVKDMLGNVIALIGWYPDEKKYVTTPSKFFSKSCLFYGMEQLNKTGVGKNYIIVEGIFDSLSVQSIGLNCIAQMGITCSKQKTIMYSLFSNLIAIPDNDTEGRSVILNDKWNLPSRSKYFRWIGDKSKDIDVFCNSYEAEDVKSLLENSFKDTRRVVSVKV